jgi:cation diffusion facilitator CzcD-associated flavoprotein CzcO
MFYLTNSYLNNVNQLANWLEFYADALELNIWTSSTVTKATQDPKTNIWSVVVKKDNGTERVFNVKNVVLAIGFKGGKGYMPSIPGIVGTRQLLILILTLIINLFPPQ